jgi:hypothetical protein
LATWEKHEIERLRRSHNFLEHRRGSYFVTQCCVFKSGDGIVPHEEVLGGEGDASCHCRQKADFIGGDTGFVGPPEKHGAYPAIRRGQWDGVSQFQLPVPEPFPTVRERLVRDYGSLLMF